MDGLRICTIAAGPERGMRREHAPSEGVEQASPAYAEVKFRFLLSEPPESTSRSDINENGHDRARLPSIMKRRQDLPEKRHLLHPEDEVFEESFALDPLSSPPPERRASHNQVEDDFVESEHKKRRRRGRRRSELLSVALHCVCVR
ncbi:hypothetical protein Y032_0019g3878 [Ancylostoma ceylanicum]|uniref:Uncharacterized protein n=1 Tax=Ancylostoma ceylanicum TaxID=53326 RepID=A0A016V291_9BILA|nr:hypothetical protein Y032_0019g3878 [Ancylostoma ceylanicum]